MPMVWNIHANIVHGRVQLRPGLVETPLEHRRAGEGEGHREADVAGVEHRRMDREREILQHRIQVRAVARRPVSGAQTDSKSTA